MRIGQLRTLLTTLRAAGVTEYIDCARGRSLTMRLSGRTATDQRAGARAEPTAQRASVEMLRDLGVTEEQAREVVSRVE